VKRIHDNASNFGVPCHGREIGEAHEILARFSVFEEVELVTKDLVFDKFFFETGVDQMQPEKPWQ